MIRGWQKGDAKARRREGAKGALVKTLVGKEMELNAKIKENQRLRAGQRVRIRETAKNKDIHGEVCTFSKYTDVHVEIDGVTYRVVTNSLEMPSNDTQRLKPGDEVTIGQGTDKPWIRGRTGEFVKYVRVEVNIDGAEHGLSPNSVEAV